MVVTIEKYGNNSAASIPLAFDQSFWEGKLRKGDLVILVGFGAGLTLWRQPVAVLKEA